MKLDDTFDVLEPETILNDPDTPESTKDICRLLLLTEGINFWSTFKKLGYSSSIYLLIPNSRENNLTIHPQTNYLVSLLENNLNQFEAFGIKIDRNPRGFTPGLPSYSFDPRQLRTPMALFDFASHLKNQINDKIMILYKTVGEPDLSYEDIYLSRHLCQISYKHNKPISFQLKNGELPQWAKLLANLIDPKNEEHRISYYEVHKITGKIKTWESNKEDDQYMRNTIKPMIQNIKSKLKEAGMEKSLANECIQTKRGYVHLGTTK